MQSLKIMNNPENLIRQGRINKRAISSTIALFSISALMTLSSSCTIGYLLPRHEYSQARELQSQVLPAFAYQDRGERLGLAE